MCPESFSVSLEGMHLGVPGTVSPRHSLDVRRVLPYDEGDDIGSVVDNA